MLAHELRNPLTPIRNAAAILGRIPTEGPLLSKVQGIIERQVQNMSRLVEDMLDVSRVNAGKLRLDMESVDMSRLIEDVVQACRPSMDSRLQLFEVKVSGAPLHLNGTGLGIGLTVVRELVEGHGGHVAAFSDGKGRGSRFVVTLPLATGPSEAR